MKDSLPNTSLSSQSIPSCYFFTENDTKYRLVFRGCNAKGEAYYDWECRDISKTNSEWEGGVFGTEQYLSGQGKMTEQDKEWAKKNARNL